MDFFKFALDSLVSQNVLFTNPEWTTIQLPMYQKTVTQSEYQKITIPTGGTVTIPTSHLGSPLAFILCNTDAGATVIADVPLDQPLAFPAITPVSKFNVVPGGYIALTTISKTRVVNVEAPPTVFTPTIITTPITLTNPAGPPALVYIILVS